MAWCKLKEVCRHCRHMRGVDTVISVAIDTVISVAMRQQ